MAWSAGAPPACSGNATLPSANAGRPVVDSASYQACIRSLWAVAEHMQAIDLSELQQCAERSGTEEERRLVKVIRRMARHVPKPPAHRRNCGNGQ